MELSQLGDTLVIANPTAHSGRGAASADFVERVFSSYSSAATRFEMYRTRTPLDATRKAAEGASFDTVIALGGDGVIHEVVNGLMRIDEDRRPALAVIPIASRIPNVIATVIRIPIKALFFITFYLPAY